ncbi:MAG: hypothetical protein AUI47_02225 [Acidobacteria bacterium 13_1_40CM_2_68_5]|nr:MAG: hypothetical protein AUI47_02225 [Acidobacteria bacterium 13_1_40CM_2_68_5]
MKHRLAVVAQEPRGDLHVSLLERVASAHDGHELLDQVRRQRFLLGVALHGDLRPARRYPHAHILLDRPEVFVMVAEDVDQDFFRKCDFAHPAGCAPQRLMWPKAMAVS